MWVETAAGGKQGYDGGKMGREREGSQVEHQMRGVQEESRLPDLHVVLWAAMNLRESVSGSLSAVKSPRT